MCWEEEVVLGRRVHEELGVEKEKLREKGDNTLYACLKLSKYKENQCLTLFLALERKLSS